MRKKDFLNAQKLEFGHMIENLFYFHNCMKNRVCNNLYKNELPGAGDTGETEAGKRIQIFSYKKIKI